MREADSGLLELAVEYPPRLSRLLIFVKWLLAVPHCLALFAYALVFGAVTFVAWFAILFTSRFPQGLFRFVEGALR